MSEYIEVEHLRVGAIRVPAESVLHLEPLPGFPKSRRFALVSEVESDAFAWLASLDDLELSFRVADPRSFFPDYDPFEAGKLPAGLVDEDREHLVLLAIANLSDDRPRLNLAAPLVVDARTRRGRQVVFDDDRYSVGEPLTAENISAKAADRSKPVAAPSRTAAQIESNPQR